MAQESQKATTSEVVRIWKEPKKRLSKVREAQAKKLGRPVSEAELVSRAVSVMCSKEERKLGIV